MAKSATLLMHKKELLEVLIEHHRTDQLCRIVYSSPCFRNYFYYRRCSMVAQDLHIHSVWSTGDSAVVPEQNIPFIAAVDHARIRGMSDHFDYLAGEQFEGYAESCRKYGFYTGTEVNGHDWVAEALGYPFDYYIYHCRNTAADYAGAETLLSSGKPVIIAHPFTMETNISRVAPECLIEINNRYIWRHRWQILLQPFVEKRRFIISSDAHQPNWLSQTVARYVASEMGITEELLFADRRPAGASVAAES